MCKLPFILFASVYLAYFLPKLLNGELKIGKALLVLGSFLLFLIPFFVWYGKVIPTWGKDGVLVGIFSNTYQSNYLEIIGGTFVSILPELLLNYGAVLFFLAGFYFMIRNKTYTDSRFIPLAMLGVCLIGYFIFEANIIALVHDYYLFPFLPLLFTLVAYGAVHLIQSKQKWIVIISVLALFILPLTAYLRCQSRWNPKEPGFNVAYYNHKAELRNLLSKDGLCLIENDISGVIALYYLDRKGFMLNENYNSKSFNDFKNLGVKYFVVDSKADTSIIQKPFLTKKIFDKDDLRVYEL